MGAAANCFCEILVDQFREAEVSNLDSELAVHEYVLELEVSVHDAFVVNVLDAEADVLEKGTGFFLLEPLDSLLL